MTITHSTTASTDVVVFETGGLQTLRFWTSAASKSNSEILVLAGLQMVGPPRFELGTSCTPTKKRLHTHPPHAENKAVTVLDLRELCGNFAGFGDFAGIVRDEKPRLDGVGGIPNGYRKKVPGGCHEYRGFRSGSSS